jgi:hypothetical protein
MTVLASFKALPIALRGWFDRVRLEVVTGSHGRGANCPGPTTSTMLYYGSWPSDSSHIGR